MYPTLNEIFDRAVTSHKEAIALRMLIPKERKKGRGIQLVLNEISYNRLGEMVARLAGALDELGVKKGDKVALISKPRVAWATAFFAILRCGAAVVPLNPDLQQKEIERILTEAEVKSVIISGLKNDDLLAIKERSLSHLTLISMDRPKKEEGVLFLDALLLGRKPLPAVKVSPDDLAILMYTSGTTGNAKGAMLLHRNLSSNAITAVETVDLVSSDTFLTIVPWHHIYGLTVTLITPILAGATTSYAPVDRNLAQVMLKARPTILLGVPKLYNVLYGKVMASIEGSLLKKLIYKLSPTLMGKLVTKKLFGKDFRFLTSGGAPLSREIETGFRKMGIGIMEGYGLTETSPILTMSEAFAVEPGMTAFDEVSIRIDHPDENGIGEVVVKGPNIMAGYYKNPEATREVIDEQGWFHTGDLGSLKGGRLLLSGRAKNVIVLDTGENVYPEEVEFELVAIPAIEEIMVYQGKRQGSP
ncbi:MAG: AMP-binding protein, partial [Candidatus Bipolaricaulota bacterium]|nr:AMP-binding protein [Candidatus Bipolaricaulota bacterium]